MSPWLQFPGRSRPIGALVLALAGGSAALVVGGGFAALRGPDTGASPGPAAPLRIAPPDSAALRLVDSALALERAGRLAEARAGYRQAVERVPIIGDWLRLRVAGLTGDSLERAELYRDVVHDPARARVPLVEVAARERDGDLAGAAAELRRAGRTGAALRLAWKSAGPAAPARLRREVLSFLRDSARSSEAPALVDLLARDQGLGPADLLPLAQAALEAGSPRQAAALFARGLRTGGTAADRFSYGTALFQLGRYTEAAGQFSRAGGDATLGGQASYQRARSLLRAGRAGEARTVLAGIVRRHAGDSVAAPAALFLQADLARDARDFDQAGRLWRQLADRYPRAPQAARARFLAALLSWSRGRFTEAATDWDSVWVWHPDDEEALAATYWSGRAWARAGDAARAQERLRKVVQRSRLSYYAFASARLLGTPLRPDSAADPGPLAPWLDSARVRLAVLRATGLETELRLEAQAVAGRADGPAETVAAGQALHDVGRTWEAIRLGWRGVGLGAESRAAFGLIFPWYYEDLIRRESDARRVDPALAAALIRQESTFDARAVSRAGARGLMQIMPALGRELARREGLRPWATDRLHDPDINVRFGIRHLAAVLQQYGAVEHALAAYNAGGSRVERWKTLPGASDPETFIEWIPFTETRGYVRTVLRNWEVYRELYGG